MNCYAAQECDWARGYVAGSMTATAVPQAKAPVTTFWEGEIVGCGPHKFHSCQARAVPAFKEVITTILILCKLDYYCVN